MPSKPSTRTDPGGLVVAVEAARARWKRIQVVDGTRVLHQVLDCCRDFYFGRAKLCGRKSRHLQAGALDHLQTSDHQDRCMQCVDRQEAQGRSQRRVGRKAREERCACTLGGP